MFDFVLSHSRPDSTSAYLLDQDGEPSHFISFYVHPNRTRIVAREIVEPIGDVPFRNTLAIYNHDHLGTHSKQLDQVVD